MKRKRSETDTTQNRVGMYIVDEANLEMEQYIIYKIDL